MHSRFASERKTEVEIGRTISMGTNAAQSEVASLSLPGPGVGEPRGFALSSAIFFSLSSQAPVSVVSQALRRKGKKEEARLSWFSSQHIYLYENTMSLPSVTRSALRASLRASSRSAQQAAVRPYSLLSQGASRSGAKAETANAAAKAFAVQQRGVKTLDFAGTKEVVYERADWPLEKLQDYFKNDTFALVRTHFIWLITIYLSNPFLLLSPPL